MAASILFQIQIAHNAIQDYECKKMKSLGIFLRYRNWIGAALILGFIAWYPMAYPPETVLGITKWVVLLFGLLSAFFWVQASQLPISVMDAGLFESNQSEALADFNSKMTQAARLNKAAAFCAAITAIALANDAYLTIFWRAALF